LRAKHFLALLTVGALAGCGSPEPGFFSRTMSSAQSAGPAPGIEKIDSIPVDELSTSGTTALDESTPCASVPPDVVAPAGFTEAPVADDRPGCVWLSADSLVLTVSSIIEESMADAVADHTRMAPDLPHLTWLRVDGHYVIERILASDTASTCFLTVDVSAPKPVNVHVYRLDPQTQQAVDVDPRKAAEAFCPTARHVAQNLLRHLDPQ
jgi:hypothetical protein